MSKKGKAAFDYVLGFVLACVVICLIVVPAWLVSAEQAGEPDLSTHVHSFEHDHYRYTVYETDDGVILLDKEPIEEYRSRQVAEEQGD